MRIGEASKTGRNGRARRPSLLGAVLKPSMPNAGNMLTGGWLVTLSDCMLLLLTFFVMLVAMSGVNNERWHELSASLAMALRPITALDPRPFPRPFASEDAAAGKRDVDYMAALMAGTLAGDRAMAGVMQQRTAEGLAIRLPSSAFEKHEVSPSGRAALAAIAERLRLVDNELVVRVQVSPESPGWPAAMARGLAVSQALASLGFPRPVAVLGGIEASVAPIDELELVLRPGRAGGT